ncbi:MAG: AbrB/MazE/SpoVT family DNA-binding domain-containing protein [Chthoniobacterales bacterium]|jgi:bifunctional DNA-binding transcriptional regulator/antitoxin component of YhaV-PrlF toxin-antitoxin module
MSSASTLLPSSLVTGKLQTTIPAALARRHGIKTGTRLEWLPDSKAKTLVARVLPDAVTQLREAQKIAASNRKAAANLKTEYAAEQAWQFKHDRKV